MDWQMHLSTTHKGDFSMKRFGILAAALAIMSSPAQAQFVSSVSVDREMKRLGQACVAYAEVGKTGMPDFSKAGYKLQKQ